VPPLRVGWSTFVVSVRGRSMPAPTGWLVDCCQFVLSLTIHARDAEGGVPYGLIGRRLLACLTIAIHARAISDRPYGVASRRCFVCFIIATHARAINNRPYDETFTKTVDIN